MRLGTSGFGVIAIVSLLVTAAPEKTDVKEDRGGIDSSITWPVSVVSAISRIAPTRSRFVKIEEQDIQSSSLTSKTSSTVPPFRPQRSTLPLSVVPNTETPTKLPRYLDGLSTRVPKQIRNSKGYSTKTDDWLVPVESAENGKSNVEESASPNSSNLATLGNFDVGFIAENSSSRSSMFEDTPLAHLSSVLHRYARHRSREGKTREEGIAKGSTGKRKEMTGDVEATTTSYHLTTWMTSPTKKYVTPDRISALAIFREPTEHYESQIVRNMPASEFAKDNLQSGFVNDSGKPVSQFKDETMSSPGKNVSRYPADHQISQRSYVPSQTTGDSRVNHRGLRIPFIGDSRIDKLTAPGFTSSNNSDPNGSRQQSSTYEPASLDKRRSSTPRTLDQVTLRKHETEYGIVEETIRARRITHETFSEVPIIERETTYQGIVDNANGVDLLVPSKDNHIAIGARSFDTTSVENEKGGNSPTGVSSFPSRFPKRLGFKDTPDYETSPLADKTSSLAANQIIPAKSGYPNAKNNTGQSINFLDGKSKKIFYEIKPSVITDTDRLDDLDLPITTTITTTRQSFDKFLLSSVPSVYGKFGPYFIDEEDRRNVTERIGSTVQLDCRIGFLGDRKVTWLHYYKDSFRLLTVKKESYSVDRRISLNFQYPDNWRLQIAYASIRDSGLYKCQVEIDFNKSLVKRYYVLITAPTLTITDDSGRPVSGERHLKAGSALKLRCEARDVIPGLNESVLWMRGDETLTDDVSENRTAEIVDEREITVVISTLLVERAAPTHAGNYSCVVPDKARTTIAVHVLNGELPAAVQHGSGVSTAVLNIWLIHLTASYGFLR